MHAPRLRQKQESDPLRFSFFGDDVLSDRDRHDRDETLAGDSGLDRSDIFQVAGHETPGIRELVSRDPKEERLPCS